jgi:hypothetical protein
VEVQEGKGRAVGVGGGASSLSSWTTLECRWTDERSWLLGKIANGSASRAAPGAITDRHQGSRRWPPPAAGMRR